MVTPDEKPKFGSEGATTWKEGVVEEVRRGRIFWTSRKEPGPVMSREVLAEIVIPLPTRSVDGATHIRGRKAEE